MGLGGGRAGGRRPSPVFLVLSFTGGQDFLGAGGEKDQVKEWRARCIFVAVLLLMLAAGCVIMPGNAFALYLVKSQDMPVLVMLSLSIIGAAFWPPSWALPRYFPRWWVLLLAGLVLAALLAWG